MLCEEALLTLIYKQCELDQYNTKWCQEAVSISHKIFHHKILTPQHWYLKLLDQSEISQTVQQQKTFTAPRHARSYVIGYKMSLSVHADYVITQILLFFEI